MKHWKKWSSLALALIMSLSLAACGAPSNESPAPGGSDGPGQSSEPAGPKTLTVGTMDATDTFDPCSNANCGLGLTMVYDTILKLNYETMEVEPSIATSWEWVEDDLLKLTIRDDAVFSNGDPLTPEDVLYSLSRFVFENNQFDPGYDDIDYDNSYIEGNDLYLKLTTVSADLLYNLSNDRWASVVNEEYVKANPDAWWNAPCGTGPYVCDENVEGSHSTYTRRDDYWGELPDAETVTIRHYSEATTMIADFENGALDIALDVAEADYLAAQDGAYDFATAIPILMANGTDISIFGTGGGTYLDSQVLDTIGQNSTNGGARVSDPEFNEHIEAARVAKDEQTRQAEYDAVQQWAFDNYRTLPIGYAQAVVLYHNNIGNVTGLNARSIDIVAVTVA